MVRIWEPRFLPDGRVTNGAKQNPQSDDDDGHKRQVCVAFPAAAPGSVPPSSSQGGLISLRDSKHSFHNGGQQGWEVCRLAWEWAGREAFTRPPWRRMPGSERT